jgi:predicted O-linked N-acetylglucosamine transferase (SPINDLY family)
MPMGVAPERLIFAPRVAPPEYLARFQLADLVLDTFPYNAGTTASDALWMGTPIVTRAAAPTSRAWPAACSPRWACPT